MPSSIVVLVAGCASAVIWMTVLYAVRRMTRNAGIVDVGWALGVGMLAVALAITGSGAASRRIVLAILAGAWSFRLGLYLLTDRVLHAQEDGRYRALLESWGRRAERNLFLLYLAQAGFIALFCIPFLPIVNSPVPAGTGWDAVALSIWVVAILGESLADRQLAQWRADPAHQGRTCRRGLWRYTRHPNYFFEWLHWWTYPFLAFGAPWAALTLLGPAVMLLFLFRFTGIPYTEAQALKSRGADYAQYQRTTSAFFPWFPRSNE
jgi:steroid 5-alpha reductase family enzyme